MGNGMRFLACIPLIVAAMVVCAYVKNDESEPPKVSEIIVRYRTDSYYKFKASHDAMVEQAASHEGADVKLEGETAPRESAWKINRPLDREAAWQLIRAIQENDETIEEVRPKDTNAIEH